MSKEGSLELTKSWVFVDPEKQPSGVDTSGVQEVVENERHIDSDTDSISVISESGCSYKTDEEEFSPTEEPAGEQEVDSDQPEIIEKQPKVAKEDSETVVPAEPCVIQQFDENRAIEKLLYFATSAVCAIILVGFSVAVQHYFRNASDMNVFDQDKAVFHHVQNVESEVIKETPSSKFNLKRQSQLKLDELENKIAKLQEDNEFSDKDIFSAEGNDLKSNNKLNKNKNTVVNCDVHEKGGKTHDLHGTDTNDKETQKTAFEQKQETSDKTYNKKVKELKIKEDYLRQKEKFLIEKEHDLLKKEIKFNKEKQNHVKNKRDKKTYHKKEKQYKKDSPAEVFSEQKSKFKSYKDRPENRKHEYKEEKKQYSTQKRYRFFDEENKKRNISGQWYINLHQGRDSMRQKKRASFKKNKANWYFQWMVDRARLRVK